MTKTFEKDAGPEKAPLTILNIHSTTCRWFSSARKAEDIVSGLAFGIHQAQKAIATASGY